MEQNIDSEMLVYSNILSFYLIVILAVFVFSVIVYWKIFTKAGEDGWKSMIPVYNNYILYKITYGNGWLFLLTLIPCLGFFIELNQKFDLAKVYGKDIGFGIGIFFLGIIFLPILAFGSSEYQEETSLLDFNYK